MKIMIKIEKRADPEARKQDPSSERLTKTKRNRLYPPTKKKKKGRKSKTKTGKTSCGIWWVLLTHHCK
uniref:Uncharacterized protein n=1 Tax=Rhizophora mucronata TaxID=61149 RepID=A0A2P2N1V5_RHIMU